MIDATNAGIIDVLDRDLILLGFAGPFSRSELVGWTRRIAHFGKYRLTIKLRRAKTDEQRRATRSGYHTGESRDVPGSHGSSLAGTGSYHGRSAAAPTQSYFGNTGIVVTAPVDVARRPSTLIWPPAGLSNSTVPRLPATEA